jgi:hypothetical protein
VMAVPVPGSSSCIDASWIEIANSWDSSAFPWSASLSTRRTSTSPNVDVDVDVDVDFSESKSNRHRSTRYGRPFSDLDSRMRSPVNSVSITVIIPARKAQHTSRPLIQPILRPLALLSLGDNGLNLGCRGRHSRHSRGFERRCWECIE